MDKNTLEKQYRKGIISYHEYMIKLWFLGGSISQDEMESVLKDIGECCEQARKMAKTLNID